MNMPEFLVLSEAEGGLQLRAAGGWTSGNAGLLEKKIDLVIAQAPTGRRVKIDLSGITEFDTFGAWLLQRLRRDLAVSGADVELSGLAERNRPLLAEMEEVDPERVSKPRRRDTMDVIAEGLTGIARDLWSFITLFGAFITGLLRLITRPRDFRFTSTVFQFDRVGFQALPIVILVTFIIGAILAQQGFFHFRNFGADLYVINMVGFLVMRELGVLLVAIMVAGRSGSSYTAELGSMKMQEEIDALRTMGFDPIEILIVPRVLVLIVVLPVLTFIGSMAALLGAGIVAVFYADLSPQLFISQLNEAITVTHFQVGMIKAPFIGAVIGVIACAEGLRVRGSATSLGTHTTRAVVKSIFMVIVFDGLFAMFFTAIGM
jgi:phospholipid/cholesterol/gamma-HCH transport system permease protein